MNERTAKMRVNQDESGSARAAKHAAYIGLDVHKETIAIAVALPGRESPDYHGEIANTPKALRRWLDRLNNEFGGEVLLFCYEAGPCGYGLYRQLIAAGHDWVALTLCTRRRPIFIDTVRFSG
jgi:hypothetical protein